MLTTPLPLFHVAALHIVSNSALHAGCTAYLQGAASQRRTFWQEIADDGATFAILLGPLAAILLKTAASAPSTGSRSSSACRSRPTAREFERRFKVTLLWQGYGMTEVYPHPMQGEMEPGVPYDTVGHAAAWIEYGAVDEHDRLLPPGEIGQLVYRPRLTDAMARGYYKNPEATVEAFRNFMFHTGDVGFVDEEGRVHFLGRLQDRIRRRGENISAAELELIAIGHPRSPRRRRSASRASSASTRSSSTSRPRDPTSTRRVPRLAGRAAAALHGPAVHRAPRRAAQELEREDPEAQADRGRRSTAPRSSTFEPARRAWRRSTPTSRA